MRSEMKRMLFLLAFLPLTLFAQSPSKIDSLRARLAILKPDTSKLSTLNALSEALWRKGEYDSSFVIANDAVELSKKLLSASEFGTWPKIGLAKAYCNLGCISMQHVKYDEALKWHYDAEKVGAEAVSEHPKDVFGKRTLALIHNTTGGLHYFKGNYDKALASYIAALKLFEEIKEKQRIASVYNNIGLIHEEKKDFTKAIGYYSKSLAMQTEMRNKKGMASAYNNLGNMARELKDEPGALEYYFKAVELNKETNNKNWLAFNYENIGNSYRDLKEFKKAIDYYTMSLALRKEIKEVRGTASSYASMGEMYFLQGDYNIAKEHALLGYETAKKIGARLEIVKACYTLARADSALGDFKSAYFYQRMYTQFKDTILNEESSKQIAEMQTKYETEKKEQQIGMLQQQEANQRLEISKQQLQIWVLIALTLLIVTSSLLFYNRYKQKQKQIMAQKLLEEQALRYSSVVEAQENEKVRIARDLHDGVCQMLAATKMRFSNLNDDVQHHIPQRAGNYKECIDLLDEATTELRTVAHEIMPPALKEHGLEQALKNLASQTFYPHTKYSLEVFGKLPRLNSSAEINIYRVAQELFANVLKHAGATEVSIQLMATASRLSLVVEDNGKGFKSDKPAGMGMNNINLRAQMLNAKFNIEPGPNGGTVATLTLALQTEPVLQKQI